LELELVSAQGDHKWVRTIGLPVKQGGRVVQVKGIFQDITARKQAEKKLVRSERVLQLFVEHTPAAIAMFDREMKYIVASQRYLLDYDLGPQNLVGRSHYEVFPEIPERWKEIHRRCLAGATERCEEDPFPRADGHLDWVHWEICPWYEDTGEIGGIILFSEVITARKLVEAEIRRLNAELERRVTERTAELAATNQELEAFTYSVSHDLRAPLRAIDGFSRIILHDYASQLDAEGQRLFNIVRASAQNMDQLITDLLAFSRVTRSELVRLRLDMAALVRSAYEQIAAAGAQEQVSLSIGPLEEAYGDSTLIRQVWSNLLSNALKYTRPKPERCIAIGSYAQDGMCVYFVKDNGVGFNPVYAHKLFGVFQRLHRATDFEGNGVGLAIVQRIVRRHGGQVWAEGEIDRGATFYFSLPVGGAES